MSNDELVTVATFTDVGSAQSCRSLLREHGIRSFIPDESIAVPMPSRMWKSGRAKVRLQVLPSDEVRAVAVIDQAETESASAGKVRDEDTMDIGRPEYVDHDDADYLPVQEEDEYAGDGEFIPPRDDAEVMAEELSTQPLPFSSERFSGIRFFLKIVAIIALLTMGICAIQRLI
jgi:hypothetical protein